MSTYNVDGQPLPITYDRSAAVFIKQVSLSSNLCVCAVSSTYKLKARDSDTLQQIKCNIFDRKLVYFSVDDKLLEES